MQKYTYYICLSLLAMLNACSKNDSTPPAAEEKGSMVLEFDNRAGEDDLILNTQVYRNAAGEQLKISKFNYYVSNFRFVTADGREYTVPQDSCYFLIREDDKSTFFYQVSNVPAGDYTRVRFMIGVDSLRNTMDISRRTGALDPAEGGKGMYWGWNSGYIFAKLEGASPSSTDKQQLFRYHIGLFGGYQTRTLNNTRQVECVIPNNGKAIVRKDRRGHIHFYADALQLLNGPNKVSIAAHPNVMVDPYAAQMADNYQHMFSINHVHNE